MGSPVYLSGDISGGNSTTTALSGGATFTGTEHRTSHPDIMVTLKTDQDGTLYIDLGIVSGTYDTTLSFAVTASSGEFHTAVKGTRYCRVRYTNGSTPQTYFRMQTEFGIFRQPNKGLQVALGRDDDSASVRPSDFYQEVQESRRTGYYMETKFGANPDAGTTAEDVIYAGGTYAGFPVSFTPELVTVSSSSDADNGGTATGALTVRIRGLRTSTSTSYTTENITLAGMTLVDSANTWWRINRIQVLTAGSGGANAGTITVAAKTTTSVIFGTVPVGLNQSQICAWTVPASNTAWLKRVHIQITRTTGSGVSAVATVRVREPGGVFQSRRIYNFQGDAPINYAALGGLELLAGSDVKMRIESTTTASPVEATMELLVVED